MTNRSIRIAISLTVVLAAVMLIMSCGTAPQNTNLNQNQNQNQNGIETKAAAIEYDDACDEQDVNRRRDKTQQKIDAELSRDDELKDRVKILVKTVGTSHLEAIVEGQAGGEDELEDLSRIVRKFMKRKCVVRVLFVTTGTIPSATSADRNEIFEWNACEWPNVPCTNGECVPHPCVKGIRTPTPTPRPNTNANSSSSSNSNSNSNSNANRGNGN